MAGLLRYIGRSIRRSIGINIASGLLLAMGINIESIVAGISDNPPWYLTSWWFPYVFVLLALLFISYAFYRQTKAEISLNPSPDTEIHKAVEYLVDSSTANIHKHALKYRMQDFEKKDAIALMNSEIFNKNLLVWGRKQTSAIQHGYVFEEFHTRIPNEFWDRCKIDIYAIGQAKGCPQTCPRSNGDMVAKQMAQYSELLVNWEQMTRIWPRKWVGLSLFRWIKGKITCGTR